MSPCLNLRLGHAPLHRRITAEDIEAHLMTSLAGSPPLDILIRTSGVKRLSDYLLWQVRHLALLLESRC